MALIDDIISTINKLPIGSDGTLTLSATDFAGMDFMGAFFQNLLKEAGISLGGADRSSGEQTVTVKGKADLLGYNQLDLSITFDVKDDQVVGTVTGTFDAGSSITLPVLTWIKVGDITLTTSITEQFNLVELAFGMNVITSDGTKIPVGLASLPSNKWRLDIAQDAQQAVTAAELISLLDVDDLDSFLPQELASALDNLVLNGIEATYDTDAKSIDYFSAGVHFTKGWVIAPKVSLEPGLQISLTIVNASDEATRLLTGNVLGTFKIGEVLVPISVGTSVGGTTVWSFGIQPDKTVTLPSLTDLLDLGDSADALPTGLNDIPAIDITRLLITFDSTESVLTELSFAVATDSPWTVIDDYFSIERLSIDFDITDVNVKASREVVGSVYGLFKVSDVYLFCSLAKTQENPDWTVTAGLPPDKKLDLTELGKQLLEPQITLPDDLPTIDFTKLLVTVVPDKKTFEFDAESTDKWELVPNQLSIDSFKLDFTRDPAKAPKETQGTIASTLTISTVTVSLSASLNDTEDGGWVFVGSTKKGDEIHIADFITWLTTKFSVPPPPSWIQSIVLKDVDTTLKTAKKDFTFAATADATISDKLCELQIAFSLTHEDESYSLDLSGTLTVSNQQFKLKFDKNQDGSKLLATWSEADGGSLELEDIAKLFGNQELVNALADIPSDMKLSLTSLSFTYDFTNTELVLTAVSKNYGDLVFVGAKPSESWVFVFLVAMKDIDLTHLPLIGSDIAKLGSFEIKDINLLISSGVIDEKTVKQINCLIDGAQAELPKGTELPKLPETKDGLKEGVNFSMTFEAPGLPETKFSVDTATGGNGEEGGGSVPSGSAGGSANALQAAAAPAEGGNDVKSKNGYWINIQKAVGPVYMDKVGINYVGGKLEFMFDFSMTLSALTVTLDGLMVETPLTEFEPSFGLKGLSITFKTGPVEISGGFIEQDVEVNGETVKEYNGEALIKAGDFSLSALGSYAKYDGHTSLFIFALITDPPLGGPPYFFVTGVAAGFGYNRGLKIPDIDGVPSFPLTSGFVPGKGSPFSGPDPGKALEVLVSDNVVPIQIGEDWLAAGIRFTSFEMLQSFALLVVEFGTELEIALLGTTTASIPTGDPRPLLFAELAIEIRILPDDGLVAVDAKLSSNSYLLDTSCHLTGGFAFYIWYGSNPYAGDFVVTLGGYHPNFVPPSYYPKVPLLGFNWVVSSELTIKGGMYFALTPTCLMAGGSLQALWQSGELKAWFDVGANFLIAWKPYHYEAEMYLSFGVSYTFKVDLLFATITKTISVSLGADLSIWGPSFSGSAHIHLWIVSFTVDFGAGASQKPNPIGWAEFESSFLPPASKPQTSTAMMAALAEPAPASSDQPVASSKVGSGLVSDLDPTAPDNPDNINWIVQAHGTSFQTQTLIPAKTYKITVENWPGTVTITNPSELAGINTDFGVGPCGVDHNDFASEHEIVISHEDGTISEEVEFFATAVIADVPKAMWLNADPGLSNKTLIEKVLTGFTITTGVKLPDQTPWADLTLLLTEPKCYTPALSWPSVDAVAGPAQPEDPFCELEKTIVAPAARPDVLAALRGNGFDTDPTVDVSHIASEAGDYLLAPPVFQYDYWKSAS